MAKHRKPFIVFERLMGPQEKILKFELPRLSGEKRHKELILMLYGFPSWHFKNPLIAQSKKLKS